MVRFSRLVSVTLLGVALVLPLTQAGLANTGAAEKKEIHRIALAGNFSDALTKASFYAAKAVRPQLWQNLIVVLEDSAARRISRDAAMAYFQSETALLADQSRKTLSRALADFNALTKRTTGYAPFWSAKASIQRLLGRNKDAVRSLGRAIKLASAEGWYYHNRALAYGRRNSKKALADYKRALELSPQWASVFLTNRGSLYAKTGRRAAALKDFNAAIAKRKTNPDAFYNRGNLWARKKQFKKAVSDFTQAIRFDPQFVQAYTNRGVAHRRLRKLTAAVNDHTAALRIDPRHTTALMGRAFAYSGQGKKQLALKDIRQATQISPRKFRLHMTHAMMASRAGLIAEEIAALKQVLKTLPSRLNRRKASTRKRIQRLEKQMEQRRPPR